MRDLWAEAAAMVTAADAWFNEPEANIRAKPNAAKWHKRKIKTTESVQHYICDCCGKNVQLFQMRVHFIKIDGARVPQGMYCTDCFYIEINPGPSSLCRGITRRKPSIADQEGLGMDEWLVHARQHSDCRREFGFFGDVAKRKQDASTLKQLNQAFM